MRRVQTDMHMSNKSDSDWIDCFVERGTLSHVVDRLKGLVGLRGSKQRLNSKLKLKNIMRHKCPICGCRQNESKVDSSLIWKLIHNGKLFESRPWTRKMTHKSGDKDTGIQSETISLSLHRYYNPRAKDTGLSFCGGYVSMLIYTWIYIHGTG